MAGEPTSTPMRVAVLASGRGSNLQALLCASALPGARFAVVGVFSNKPGAGALAIAADSGLQGVVVLPSDHASRQAYDEAMFSRIAAIQPDLIVCAGYMRLISAPAVLRFQGRMINIHPSLLPRYPGLHTHARALAAADAEHGASVHCVVPEVDAGPVLSQVRVPVLPGDSAEQLAHRLLPREHALLVRTVEALADRRLSMRGNSVSWHGRALGVPLLLGEDDRLEAA